MRVKRAGVGGKWIAVERGLHDRQCADPFRLMGPSRAARRRVVWLHNFASVTREIGLPVVDYGALGARSQC